MICPCLRKDWHMWCQFRKQITASKDEEFLHFWWWGLVHRHGSGKCLCDYWVLFVGCDLWRESCCIEVLVNKWYLLYRWVGNGSESKLVSYNHWSFCKVLPQVFWIQKGRPENLKRKLFFMSRWRYNSFLCRLYS